MYLINPKCGCNISELTLKFPDCFCNCNVSTVKNGVHFFAKILWQLVTLLSGTHSTVSELARRNQVEDQKYADDEQPTVVAKSFWTPRVFLLNPLVNNSRKIKNSVNKMHQIVQNMILSPGLELKLNL